MKKTTKECLTAVISMLAGSGWLTYLNYDKVESWMIEKVKPIIVTEIIYPTMRENMPIWVTNEDIFIMIDGNLSKSYFKQRIKQEAKTQLETLKADKIQETKGFMHEKVKRFKKFTQDDMPTW